MANINVLAVDGGGTRCRIACVIDGHTEVSIRGPANAFSDFEGTLEAITSGLAELSERLSLPVEDFYNVPTYLGLAGIVNTQRAQKLRAALPFNFVKIEDDRHCAVRAALGCSDGFLAHFGTGSFFAQQQGTDRRFVGGWGDVLDDIASASWVGRRALALSLYTVDGLYLPSALTKEILSEYNDPSSIVAFAARAAPVEFGRIAKKVSSHADNHDPIAVQIFKEGAVLIADHLVRLGWHDESICLTGGLGPQYRTYLSESMQRALVEANSEPLQGAIELAEEFARQVTQNNKNQMNDAN